MPLFGSLKADKSLIYAPDHHNVSLFLRDAFLYQLSSCEQFHSPIYIYIYICIYLSELPSSSFIIDFHYCQHIYNSSMPCIFQSLFAWLKSFGHQYCSHLLTTVVISSLHSFCQILMLLVACVPFHV